MLVTTVRPSELTAQKAYEAAKGRLAEVMADLRGSALSLVFVLPYLASAGLFNLSAKQLEAGAGANAP